VVCSACGYENEVGNRFCGMCGTPLPHRPLTAPGAHGTHTFTRFPWGNGKPAPEDVLSPAEQANGAIPQPRSGVLTETPTTERPKAGNSVLASRDMVPEIPLEEYVKGFRYIPPEDTGETTMRGDAEVLRAEASAVPETVDVVQRETTTTDPNSVSATEDVRARLGLDEAAPQEELHGRPRFLDFSAAAAPEKPEASVPAIAGPSFLGLSDAPSAAPPLDDPNVARDRGWNWLAVAALLVFVALGVLEWRAQGGAENNGPVQVVKTKLRNLWHGSGPTSRGSGSAETNGAKPTMQIEEQPKSQGHDVAANPKSTNAASADKSAASASNPASTPSNRQQQTPAVATLETPPGQRQTASPPPASPTTGSQPSTAQKAAAPSPTDHKTVIAPGARSGVETAAANPKPKVQPELAGEPDTQPKKLAPGAQELAKAGDASDAAAAAAWLWKATAKGNPEAPLRLADMYVKGNGVPRSCEQALVLLHAAADKGNAQARARLTQISNSGSCAQRAR
jgi:zinc-ribbon domain